MLIPSPVIRRARKPHNQSSTPDAAPPPPGVRLQRVLAAAGVAARRACEEMIAAGRVEVNGKVVRTLPVFVDPTADQITVDGRMLPRARAHRSAAAQRNTTLVGQRLLYIMVHKPEKVLSTTRDEAGRKTILDMVHHPAMAADSGPGGGGGRGAGAGGGTRLYPVGRLDFHTSGLVLLTNDGDLANRLTHPRFGVPKTYRVVLKAILTDDFLRALEDGLNKKHHRAVQERATAIGRSGPMTVSGEPPRPPHPRKPRDQDGGSAIRITPVQRDAGKTTVDISLTESGPRSISDMLGEAGMKVGKVVRTAIGPLELKGVALGQWRELERDELWSLRKAATTGGHIAIKSRAPVNDERRPRRESWAKPNGSRTRRRRRPG